MNLYYHAAANIIIGVMVGLVLLFFCGCSEESDIDTHWEQHKKYFDDGSCTPKYKIGNEIFYKCGFFEYPSLEQRFYEYCKKRGDAWICTNF